MLEKMIATYKSKPKGVRRGLWIAFFGALLTIILMTVSIAFQSYSLLFSSLLVSVANLFFTTRIVKVSRGSN